ncbi:MAG: glycosyltransferase family 2 protein [Myxococcota bacterium]
MLTIATALCTAAVLGACLPVVMGLFQYLLGPLSCLATHLDKVATRQPRVAVLIPAWNEGAVVATTIDRLLAANYPSDRLRIYVVDDASTDETPHIVIAKSKEFPGRVVHVRRVAGGEGKAHTLNYGLETALADDWTEAVLIMDADVIYTPDSLAKMCRHLGDPAVGAVTAYIKEGSANPNWVQRYVGFEYITATGVSRRAQNVLGFLTCLSGGAQLHSRENLVAIGGQIFSHTLAEDTFTTFRTQLAGRRALFEPNAIVYAEEPDGLVGLWKQRVRWARGNVQITRVFRKLWFNKSAHASMGSTAMALLWFSIFLMPLFQVGASVALVGLYFIDEPLSWLLFRGLWILAGLVYLVVTLTSFVVDPYSARRTWLEGVLFPGLISLGVIVYSLWPPLLAAAVDAVGPPEGSIASAALRIGLYSWLSLSMVVAWLAKELERLDLPWSRRLAPVVLLVGGYGPFLCAVTVGAYVKEAQGAELTWDKTVKTGKVG